jgi:hypothetical protein
MPKFYSIHYLRRGTTRKLLILLTGWVVHWDDNELFSYHNVTKSSSTMKPQFPTIFLVKIRVSQQNVCYRCIAIFNVVAIADDLCTPC